MDTFNVHILASDHDIYEGQCESLVVPTLMGQSGILAHYENTIAVIVPGELKYRLPGDEDQVLAVSHGLLRVRSNDVMVLIDSAERPEEIDENRARRAAEEAKEAMLQKKSIQEYYQAEATLARQVNRLRIKHNRKYDKS